MSFPNGVRLSDSIASKIVEGGFPANLDGLRFNSALNIWEFVPFGGGGGGFWEELARTTLAIAGDTISVTPIAVREHLMILVSVADVGGAIRAALRFNGDAGANYAYRRFFNGVAGLSVNQNEINISNNLASPKYIVVQLRNSNVNPKISSSVAVDESTSGAGTGPDSWTTYGKWQNVAQVTRIDVVNVTGAGDYAIGSEVVVLGHD